MKQSVFCILIITFFSFIYSCNTIEEGKNALFGDDEDTLKNVEDTTVNVIDVIDDRGIVTEDTAKTEIPTDSTTTTTPSYAKYYLILGSFKDVENARELYKNLSKNGSAPEMLDPENDFVRVAVKMFKDKETATQELQRVKNTQTDAWILTVE